jgi:acyl carrier protein
MHQGESLDRVCEEPAINEPAGAARGILSADSIRNWLIAETAQLLAVDSRDLRVDEPFANYGLSSMTGVILSGNIEEWLNIRLDPAVAWDYPTIESLADHLAEEVKSQRIEACKSAD